MGMGMDGLHLPRFNAKTISYYFFFEQLLSYRLTVNFTTCYAFTSPKYSGTSE